MKSYAKHSVKLKRLRKFKNKKTLLQHFYEKLHESTVDLKKQITNPF